jgi:phosphatidylinositol-3-phosphatase
MSRRLILPALLVMLLVAPAARAAAAPPPVKHVVVVWLENKNYVETFGADTKAKYFSRELVKQGQLLTNYYGTGHLSLDNYVSVVSGQPPNAQTQADCTRYTDFAGTVGPDGIAVGQGCVYPKGVLTVGDQLEAKGLTWKGYMQDMANGAGAPRTCRHPALNGSDDTQQAEVGDQYATRHNPFMYFHSIIDEQATCDANVVDLRAMDADFASEATTPNFSFVTPNLCEDGHDAPCVDGRPGGLESADAWLRTNVPKILAAPAMKKDGLLIVTFDEAEAGGPTPDGSACCGEPAGPNSPNPGGPVPGGGGGRVGAVVVSPFVAPGSTNPTAYNHYSFLRSVEDAFGLAHLGYAGQAGLRPFGDDVYGRKDAPGADTLGAVKKLKCAGTELRRGGTLAIARAHSGRIELQTVRTVRLRATVRARGRRPVVANRILRACRTSRLRVRGHGRATLQLRRGTQTIERRTVRF